MGLGPNPRMASPSPLSPRFTFQISHHHTHFSTPSRHHPHLQRFHHTPRFHDRHRPFPLHLALPLPFTRNRIYHLEKNRNHLPLRSHPPLPHGTSLTSSWPSNHRNNNQTAPDHNQCSSASPFHLHQGSDSTKDGRKDGQMDGKKDQRDT